MKMERELLKKCFKLCPSCRAIHQYEIQIDYIPKPKTELKKVRLFNWSFSGNPAAVLDSFGNILRAEPALIKEALIVVSSLQEFGIVTKLSKKINGNKLKSILEDGTDKIEGKEEQINFTILRIELYRKSLSVLHLKKGEDFYKQYYETLEILEIFCDFLRNIPGDPETSSS